MLTDILSLTPDAKVLIPTAFFASCFSTALNYINYILFKKKYYIYY